MNIIFQCIIICQLVGVLVINMYVTYLFLVLATERNPYRIVSDESIYRLDSFMNNYYDIYDIYKRGISNDMCKNEIEQNNTKMITLDEL